MILALILAATPLIGTWTGDSICTGVRAACRDERVVYHITEKDPRTVTIQMNKIVNGQEEEIGTSDFLVNARATKLWWQFERNGLTGLWSFTRSGKTMRGTLTIPPRGAVVRNVRVVKR